MPPEFRPPYAGLHARQNAAGPVEPGTVSWVREAGRGPVLPWTAEELGD